MNEPPFRSADLLASTLRPGDAASEHAFELIRFLRGRGIQVQVHSHAPVRGLPWDIRPLARHRAVGEFTLQADLTVLLYPIWFSLAESFRTAPGKRVFWYYGITPPELWGTDTHRDFLERSQMGTELAWSAHQVVAISPFIAQELHKHSGYPLERIRVVPMSVAVQEFARKPPEGELSRLRQRWGLDGKEVLLYVGRMAGNKRIDLLIQALARLKERIPAAHLLLVGDTDSIEPYREETAKLQALAQRLGVAESVTFTGRVPSIAPYFHLAQVFVTASQHEGFGVPLIEAMAAELPVVASASGAMPWVLGEGAGNGPAAGLIFPPGDVETLAEQVQRVLGDTDLRAELVARGRERARAFHREQILEQSWQALVEASQQDLLAHARETPLRAKADTALRSYRIRSRVPLLGPLIEWVRYNLTTHVKEAYLDRIVERQVMYNRQVAQEIQALREEVARLRARLDALETVETEGGEEDTDPHDRSG